jgi:holo-[acyl-carrier protein] synthase
VRPLGRRVLAIGIDVEDVASVAASITVFGDRYLDRLLTARERDILEHAGAALGAREATALFAAKEAVLKLLDLPDVGIDWHCIEISRSGRPSVRLAGFAAAAATRRGISEIAVDVTSTARFAVATALAS